MYCLIIPGSNTVINDVTDRTIELNIEVLMYKHYSDLESF